MQSQAISRNLGRSPHLGGAALRGEVDVEEAEARRCALRPLKVIE